MLRLFCVSLMCVLPGSAASAGGEPDARFWTDNTGTFTVQAKLVAMDSAARSVTLQLAEGNRVVVPLRRLSADDQAWLEQQKSIQSPRPVVLSGIRWFADLSDARTVARGGDKAADDKPILCFRALGELSGFM